MTDACCPNQAFERHPNDEIADIGSADGVEFTIGYCKSCGTKLMHCWVGGGISEGIEIISREFESRIAAVSDYTKRQELLGLWFNGLV